MTPRRAFTLVEITVAIVVVGVLVAVAANAISGASGASAREASRGQLLQTLRRARDLAVQAQGPVILDHAPASTGNGALRVSRYSGGDCSLTALAVDTGALPAPVEVRTHGDDASASLFTGPGVHAVCFRPRGGALFGDPGSSLDVTNTQQALPLPPALGGAVVLRDNGEIFLSSDATTSSAYNGTKTDTRQVPALDTGYVVGQQPALHLLSPAGQGGGGADVALVTGGGVPGANCLGLTFNTLAVQGGLALLRISPVVDAAYVGSNPCTESRPIACIDDVFGVTPDPYPGVSFAAPYDTPDWYNSFYSGWTDAVVSLAPAVTGTQLTSRAAGDAFCAKLRPGLRMLEFHDGGNGSGGWGMRVRADPSLGGVGGVFWVAINNQPANPWDY